MSVDPATDSILLATNIEEEFESNLDWEANTEYVKSTPKIL